MTHVTLVVVASRIGGSDTIGASKPIGRRPTWVMRSSSGHRRSGSGILHASSVRSRPTEIVFALDDRRGSCIARRRRWSVDSNVRASGWARVEVDPRCGATTLGTWVSTRSRQCGRQRTRCPLLRPTADANARCGARCCDRPRTSTHEVLRCCDRPRTSTHEVVPAVATDRGRQRTRWCPLLRPMRPRMPTHDVVPVLRPAADACR
jgi:hypothetical protein